MNNKMWIAIIIILVIASYTAIYFLGYKNGKNSMKPLTAEVKKENKVDVKEHSIGLVAKDSGKVTPKIISRKTEPRDTTTRNITSPEPTKPDTTTYNYTFRKIGTADSISYKDKKYPIEYSLEVPNKIIIINKVMDWFAEAILKLKLPIIEDKTKIDSVEMIIKNNYLPLPFFLDVWFYVGIVSWIITGLAIIF